MTARGKNDITQNISESKQKLSEFRQVRVSTKGLFESFFIPIDSVSWRRFHCQIPKWSKHHFYLNILIFSKSHFKKWIFSKNVKIFEKMDFFSKIYAIKSTFVENNYSLLR